MVPASTVRHLGAGGTLMFTVIFFELLVSLQGRRPPLLGEEGNQRRKTKKTTDCHFGRKMYEIEDTWNPDLGPPFGVMYCVECECVPVQRKRRIVGKVKCRNVKMECPEPNCDDPVLLTGKCCKTCPKEIPDWAQSEGVANRKFDPEDAEKGGHEYAALMVSNSSAIACQIQALASGRFALHRKNLHYTVQYVGPEPPVMIAFTDEKGHIIEEHEVHVTPLHNATYKVCGVWPKVPRVYRQALRQDGIFVHFVNHTCPDGAVGGQIAKCYAVKTETFNSILAPSGIGSRLDERQKSPFLKNVAREVQGGMVIISTATSASANKAAHFLFVFKNFLEKNDKEPMVSVRMESTQKEDNENLIEEMVVLGKVTKDTVVAELKIDFDQKIFPVMARGKLLLSVAFKHVPEMRLSGLVVPKISCNVFHAVLSTADSLDEGVIPITAVGQAVLEVENDGSLSYKIQVNGLNSPVTYVGLETQAKKAWKTVHNFTSTYEAGWANGTLPRLYIRDMELLTGEELFVNVGTERHPSHLRGMVRQRLYGDAQNGDFPLLLTGSGTAAAGQAWISVDKSCRLYYEVVLGGLHAGGGQRKAGGGRRGGDGAEEVGFVEILDASSAPGFELQAVTVVAGALGSNRELRTPQEFSGTEVDDIAEDLDKPAFARLDSGNTILHVAINITSSNGNVTRVDLQARISNLRVPVECLDRTENEVQMTEECNRVDGGTESYKCVYEGSIKEDGEQWSHSRNACLTCSCRRGKDICHPMICPSVTCPETRTLPGDCCPSCPTEDVNDPNRDNRGCYFDDHRYHIPGSSWHPYIPPFGFSQCVVCNCNASTLSVSCKKITCQVLSCSEKEAYREHPTACCKVCPNPKPKPKPKPKQTMVNTGEYEDEGSEKDPSELLAEGGCKYRGQIMSNGEEWHPRVYPFGEMRCIKCYCKDGKTRCSRQKCLHLNCDNKIVSRNDCCPKCASDNVLVSVSKGSPTSSKHPKGLQNA